MVRQTDPNQALPSQKELAERALVQKQAFGYAEILRSPEAAIYIDMSDSWLRQTRMAGRTDGPPFVRQGRKAVRYRRCDLDRWLEERRCTAGGQPHLKNQPRAEGQKTIPASIRKNLAPSTRAVERPRGGAQPRQLYQNGKGRRSRGSAQ